MTRASGLKDDFELPEASVAVLSVDIVAGSSFQINNSFKAMKHRIGMLSVTPKASEAPMAKRRGIQGHLHAAATSLMRKVGQIALRHYGQYRRRTQCSWANARGYFDPRNVPGGQRKLKRNIVYEIEEERRQKTFLPDATGCGPALRTDDSVHLASALRAASARHMAPTSSGRLTDVMDEGEEGEVLGDDEEEEEEEDETSGTKLENNNQRGVKKLTINLRDAVKIDRKLLEGVTTSSLGFLCHYLSSYPPEPPVIGTQKPLTDLCKAAPKDYLRNCLVMCSELLQWSHDILTQPERSTSTTEPSPKYPLKSAENLVVVFEQCMEEVRRHAASGSNETTPKKRRSSQRKTDAHHNIKALVSQAACLFWYLLVQLGLEYFSQERPNVFTTSEENSVSYHPVNLSRLLPEMKVSPDEANGDLGSSPILLLSRLWQWLKYDSGSGKVSLGHKDIDSWMGKLGFQLSFGIPHPDISLETLVYADLLFLYPEYSNVQYNKPLSELFPTSTTTSANCFLAYSPLTRDFLHWLSVACDVTSSEPSSKSKNQSELQSNFIQQLPVVANNAPINASFLPKHIHGQLWMIPLVQPVIDYLGCKVITSWLSLIFRESATLPNTVQADTASLLACLGQVDTLTQFGAVFSTPNTLPFTEILRSLNAHWPYARRKFASWFKRSPRVIEDSGLLSQLAHIEVEYRDSGGSANRRGQTGSILALMLPSGGISVGHRKGVTAERLLLPEIEPSPTLLEDHRLERWAEQLISSPAGFRRPTIRKDQMNPNGKSTSVPCVQLNSTSIDYRLRFSGKPVLVQRAPKEFVDFGSELWCQILRIRK
ncbi:hypothetical protein CLF_102547 [Clonorchis sinensis]|uniref:Uncharacterized protein n=1 Tax=Clonorchis sinensis TaxID=79923 RepID=H2KPS1_CLOSI|nr:hypothetical protein CLF_102547 [Clonorchis sinensis]